MVITLYMAMALNGLIARPDDRTDWSNEEWTMFLSAVHEHKNLIVGRKTYQILCKEQQVKEIFEIPIIVVSRSGYSDIRPNDFSVKSHFEAIDLCTKRGIQKPLIGGGGILNTSFLESNLVNKIIVDIEPTLFSPGYSLCCNATIEKKLELETVKRYGKSGIQISYAVII